MRIACPSCAAEYNVPDRLLAGPARTLRCSRCSAEFPLPQVEPPAPPAAPEPPPPAAEPETPPPPVRERAPVAAEVPPEDVALRRAWAASLVVVIGGAVALVAFRGAIMAAWPPATRFFAAIGLA